MGSVDDILNLIDAGLARAAGWAQPIHCGRAGCKCAPVDGHNFCQPCLDWLRGDDIDEPPADQATVLPDVSAPNPEPVDQVVSWVATFTNTPVVSS